MTDDEQRHIIGQVMLDLAAARKLLACLDSKANRLEADMRSVQHTLRHRDPSLVPEIPSRENVERLISDIHAARDEVLRLEGERDRLGV